MDIIIQYIITAIVSYIVAQIMLNHIKFKQNLRMEQHEKKKQNRAKGKYSRINLQNPLLNQITQSRFIIIKGGWGKGKSLLMNVIAKYLYDKNQYLNNKNMRYYKYMNAEYLEEVNHLNNQNLLPIYSNLELIDSKTNAISQDIMPYIRLQKKAVSKAIFCIDEVASLFPKTMYYENTTDSNNELVEQKELFKKFRHYTNGWILGTEQDGQDIYIGFRKNGYALITALGTTVKLSYWGKIKRVVLDLLNFVLPAILTINLRKERNKVLFDKDLYKFYLKLFVPAYFTFPKNFYNNKQAINNYIKQKHQKYILKFEFNNNNYYFKFNNKSKFDYNTRFYKGEYDDKFDKNGNRKQ